MKKNAVALNPSIDKLLKELVAHHVANGSFVDTKIKVVADLIIKAHKREIKKECS